MLAIVDFDCYKFHCASAGEKREVEVVHKITGERWVVNNRTEFYGHYKSKGKSDKCLLYQINQERDSPYLWDEFDYNDIQIPEPIENILYSTKQMIRTDLTLSGAKTFTGYVGRGKSQRIEQSTLLQYKGNRVETLKPVHLDAVTDFIVRKFKAKEAIGLEADDFIVMEAFSNKDSYVVGEDKDYFGQPVKFWDRNQQDRGIVNCDCFGELFIDSKNKVRGFGRQFLYFQILSGDSTDNYKANCFSEKRWGEKDAYKALVGSKSDKTSFQVLINCYKELYPEKKKVTGWRGNEIEIDWLYVLEENFQMARMLRFENDIVKIEDVLNKYNLI